MPSWISEPDYSRGNRKTTLISTRPLNSSKGSVGNSEWLRCWRAGKLTSPAGENHPRSADAACVSPVARRHPRDTSPVARPEGAVMKEVLCTYEIGDTVRPKPEWLDDTNNVPTGRIMQIEPWGSEGALYVGDEGRAFAAYVFDARLDARMGRALRQPRPRRSSSQTHCGAARQGGG